MKIVRIGIDARMYGPQQTGIGNYIKYLIEELVRLDKKNTYYIFLRKEEYSKFNNLSSSLNRLGIAQHLASGKKRNSKFSKILADFPWYSLVEQTLFLRALLKEPLDLMHFPHFNVPLLYSRPFIVTIHDITPKFSPGEKAGSSWPRRRAYDAVLRHAMNTSRAIITPSQFTKNDILNYFTIPPEKIHVIYEGIPTYLRAKDLLSAKSGMPRRQILKSKNPPFGQNLAARYVRSKNYLLYVGVWRSHKNLCGL
ncbi:glycosyltransferase, partial [Candidatus Curtissbacteria bacterium]|nr:glycosyltransferase [Candidatus Curtissbacteria bacterium]